MRAMTASTICTLRRGGLIFILFENDTRMTLGCENEGLKRSWKKIEGKLECALPHKYRF